MNELTGSCMLVSGSRDTVTDIITVGMNLKCPSRQRIPMHIKLSRHVNDKRMQHVQNSTNFPLPRSR